MTLKFNDYALINGYPGVGGVNPPWKHMWAQSTGYVDMLTFAANFQPRKEDWIAFAILQQNP